MPFTNESILDLMMTNARNELVRAAREYERMERALERLVKVAQDKHPPLEEMAKLVGMSPFHFQRTFTRWVGVSPKQFMSLISVENAKRLLDEDRSILDTSLEIGMSGPSRLHDLFIKVEAMTPGEYKAQGAQLEIRYGFHPTPLGQCFVAVTSRGICNLSFGDEKELQREREEFSLRWSRARLCYDQVATLQYVQRIFETSAPLEGKRPEQLRDVPILLRGTPFQLSVWRALLRIPTDSAASYEEIARSVGKPKAHRAVASAVANNPISYLVPCHRVIRKLGVIGKYRWGPSRKKLLWAWEKKSRLNEHEKADLKN